MRARTKTKAKKVSRATRSRPRRKKVLESVAPVAVQSGNSTSMVIPATVRGNGNSAKAVIAVEVKRGNKVRKRAAVIPISVRKRPKAVAKAQMAKRGHSDETRWSDPITDSVMYGTRVAEGLIGVAHQIGAAAVDTAEGLSRALFARMTERATAITSAADRAITSAADRAAATIEFAAFAPSTRVHHTEARAA